MFCFQSQSSASSLRAFIGVLERAYVRLFLIRHLNQPFARSSVGAAARTASSNPVHQCPPSTPRLCTVLSIPHAAPPRPWHVKGRASSRLDAAYSLPRGPMSQHDGGGRIIAWIIIGPVDASPAALVQTAVTVAALRLERLNLSLAATLELLIAFLCSLAKIAMDIRCSVASTTGHAYCTIGATMTIMERCTFMAGRTDSAVRSLQLCSYPKKEV